MTQEQGASAKADRACAPDGVEPATQSQAEPLVPSADETHLHVSESDKPLAFLELDDATLGKFARQYLIQVERAVRLSAGDRDMPLFLATSMHGAIALYRIAAQANAGELHLTHEDVTWGDGPQGDWEVIVRRFPAQAIEARSGETAQPVRSVGRKRGPQDAS